MTTLAITLPGGPEWAIILLIFVLLFGAKKLPELGSSVGRSIKNFKRGINEAQDEDETAPADDADRAPAARDTE
jgi:sec-independent protein translocase protein TatA